MNESNRLQQNKVEQMPGLWITDAIVFMLLLWYLMPLASNALSWLGVTTKMISLLAVGVAVFYLNFRMLSLPQDLVWEILCFVIYCLFCYFVYQGDHLYCMDTGTGSVYLYSEVKDTKDVYHFFTNVAYVLVPMICLLNTVQPSKKAKTLFEVTLFITLLVNVFFVYKATGIYADAVRMEGARDEMMAERHGYAGLTFGLVSYASVYSLAVLVPTIYHNFKKTIGVKKWIAFLMIVITLYITLKSNLVTAGLLSVIGIIVYEILHMNKRYRTVALVVFLVVILALAPFFGTLLEGVAHVLGTDTTWGRKIIDIHDSIYETESTGDVKARSDLYMMSLEAFGKSPVLGSLQNEVCLMGGHSTILDMLATIGIVGTGFFLGFLYAAYHFCRRLIFYQEHSEVVNATFIIVILMMILKNTITSYAIYVTIFVLLPAYFAMCPSDAPRIEGGLPHESA